MEKSTRDCPRPSPNRSCLTSSSNASLSRATGHRSGSVASVPIFWSRAAAHRPATSGEASAVSQSIASSKSRIARGASLTLKVVPASDVLSELVQRDSLSFIELLHALPDRFNRLDPLRQLEEPLV